MTGISKKLMKSQLFVQPQTERKFYSIPLTVITYFFLWLAGLLLGRILALIILNGLGDAGNSIAGYSIAGYSIALRKLIVCGTQIGIFFLWVKVVEKRPVISLGFQSKKPLKTYLIGFMVGLSAITSIALILALSGAVNFVIPNGNDNNLALIGSLALNFVLIMIGWIIQSASEEIAIRGWLIPGLAKHSNPVAAIIITAVIFGILHLFSSGVTVLSFINLTLSGVFFACYAIYTGNIWGVCGLHFAWNFALGNVFGFAVSGFADNGETLLEAKQAALTFLTGGLFGPEGGFITSVVLIIANIILIKKLTGKFN